MCNSVLKPDPVDFFMAPAFAMAGLFRYQLDFFKGWLEGVNCFQQEETRKLQNGGVIDWQAYNDLGKLNLEFANEAIRGSCKAAANFGTDMILDFWNNPLAWAEKWTKTCETMGNFQEKIKEVEPEYGLHLEKEDEYKLISETDRFWLYQVLPLNGAEIRTDVKPILIIPPYVLGPNILAFLPYQGKSYVHGYANRGVPTYIRIPKSVDEPAVAEMTLEEDYKDTRYFLSLLKEVHSQKVNLNGYCQGGFLTLVHAAAGDLKGLVDTVINCVAPADGTNSPGLSEFLSRLPARFRDLNYGKINGGNSEPVASGDLMSWVYKLKALDQEFPSVTFLNDTSMVFNSNGEAPLPMLALNYWMYFDRRDIPRNITQASFQSYMNPIRNKTLPLMWNGGSNGFLNLQNIKDQGIGLALFFGNSDDLVEPESAKAPANHIDVDHLEGVNGGHLKMVTSTEKITQKGGGPINYHLNN